MNLSDYPQALRCGIGAWSEFWGDPWFSGTIMVTTYAIAAFLVARVSLGLRGVERSVWTVVAAFMLFQAFNTPLDLHGLLWSSGRCLAHIQGWYEERHGFQRHLLIGLAAVALTVVLVAIVVLRKHFVPNAMLVTGASLALVMTLVKGINYHYLEAVYQIPIGPLRVPDIVELVGIALVMSGAHLRRGKGGDGRARDGGRAFGSS